MAAFIGAEKLREVTPFGALIDAIERAFRRPCNLPMRMHLDISGVGTLLVMPAWEENGLLGVKVVQAFPGNSKLGKPTVNGVYMLASAISGEVQALIDAQELTARRTAASSALASKYLSRDDSRRLLILGTGRLAFEVVSAHASVRPIDHVLVWGRHPGRATSLVTRVNKELGLCAEVVTALADAIDWADVISTVTMALDPILPGRYLKPGTHIDLIGGFTPRMREADDDVMRSANIYVDSMSSALKEAGDIVNPLERGVFEKSRIRGDLFGLCSGSVPKRTSDEEITVFKAVGLALEDLAAATLAWASMGLEDDARPAAVAPIDPGIGDCS